MFIKSFIFIALVTILGALIRGLVYLVLGRPNSRSTVKALTWRIGLSFGLFLFLLIATKLHWITPHALLGVQK